MNKAKVESIIIADKIYISKTGVEDAEHLRSLYTYHNGEEFLSTIEETDECFIVPSNSYNKLEWNSIEDRRNFKALDYNIEFNGVLRPEQQEAVDKFFNRSRARSGLLQAPPGWGKTFAACNLIARNNTRTLILVHTKLLFRQWLKELEQQLPDVKIGKIGDGLFSVEDITVAIYKTAYNNLDTLREEFSCLLVDEAHKCPADMFSTVVNNINCKIKIAITATPRRKDGKHLFLPDYFTDYHIIAEDSRDLVTPSVKLIPTDFKFVIRDPKRDWARALNKLCSDEVYIEFVANLANSYIAKGRCPLILGERVQMLKDIQSRIPNSICLIGSTSEEEREDGLEGLGTKYKAILSTKLFDEGISCHRLDTLILTCPSNNTIQLEQRIGRIERLHPEAQDPLVVDIQLVGNIVKRQQNNRILWYQKRGYDIF
jgi:superfamily II DNA or RNA helicase